MKQVYLPDGSSMPQLGQGTWQMGEDDNKYEREIAGMRHGIELGMTLIEMCIRDSYSFCNLSQTVNISHGEVCGATPDGRLAGETYCDCLLYTSRCV